MFQLLVLKPYLKPCSNIMDKKHTILDWSQASTLFVELARIWLNLGLKTTALSKAL